MNKPGRLPPFKDGLRVVPYFDPSSRQAKWRIDAREQAHIQVGVDVDGLEVETLAPAVTVLNDMATWRAKPATVDQVRSLAAEWGLA